MPDDLIGQTLGQYEIKMLLGKGGMSTVYLAYQPTMDRSVALKVLPREFLHDETFLERFKREARTVARLEHLHILPVYDVGEDQGIPYIVMRYLSGGTLADLLDKRLPDMETVVRLVGQVADALDYAHERTIIHRDLKPSNVLLDTSSNAYLADFGIARVAQSTSLTSGDHVLGTPPYVAPEMVQKGQPITHAVDVYALGVIAYEMLVGETPYYDGDPVKILMAHVMEPIPWVLDIDPNIKPAVGDVISRCLAKTPQTRYATAGAFAADLARAARSRGERPPLGPESLPTVVATPTLPAIPSQRPLPVSEAPTPPNPMPPLPGSALPEREEKEERDRLLSPGCLILLGVIGTLLIGIIAVVLAITGGNPAQLLASGPTRTPQPTVTLTPSRTPDPNSATSVEATAPLGGSGPSDLLPPPSGGARLAFASTRDGDYEIYLIDIDGANLRQLTSNNAPDYDPAWSPDGTRLAFTSNRDGDAEIWLMYADGSGVRQLTTNAAKDADPAWSPDGAWIAFSSDRGGSFDIYLMRSDGSELRQLTSEQADALSPDWSPDGSWIAYHLKLSDDSQQSDLYLVNVVSGETTRLTDNKASAQWPDWSPDGTLLAFTSSQGLPSGQRALFSYSLLSSEIKPLTGAVVHDDDPAWSPDGERLAFDSDRDGDGFFDLFVLDILSGVLQQLTFEAAQDVAPAWQPQP